jgi:hypothetical protein
MLVLRLGRLKTKKKKKKWKTIKTLNGRCGACTLTVVLSNDMVSGVNDENVLLRCAADLRIFRLAA